MLRKKSVAVCGSKSYQVSKDICRETIEEVNGVREVTRVVTLRYKQISIGKLFPSIKYTNFFSSQASENC